jgi:hypothetical protein
MPVDELYLQRVVAALIPASARGKPSELRCNPAARPIDTPTLTENKPLRDVLIQPRRLLSAAVIVLELGL